MVEETFPKDPSSVLDYSFNWVGDEDHESYLEDSETISSYTMTADAGITKDSDSEDAGIVTVWLSGGTAGTAYNVACKITTSMGRTEERSVLIRCKER